MTPVKLPARAKRMATGTEPTENKNEEETADKKEETADKKEKNDKKKEEQSKTVRRGRFLEPS